MTIEKTLMAEGIEGVQIATSGMRVFPEMEALTIGDSHENERVLSDLEQEDLMARKKRSPRSTKKKVSAKKRSKWAAAGQSTGKSKKRGASPRWSGKGGSGGGGFGGPPSAGLAGDGGTHDR
jgi:hypothetical protein